MSPCMFFGHRHLVAGNFTRWPSQNQVPSKPCSLPCVYYLLMIEAAPRQSSKQGCHICMYLYKQKTCACHCGRACIEVTETALRSSVMLLPGMFYSCHAVAAGVTSENVAAKYGIAREVQDKMAVSSHQRAAKARDTGRFKDEIVPVKTNWKDPKTGMRKNLTVLLRGQCASQRLPIVCSSFSPVHLSNLLLACRSSCEVLPDGNEEFCGCSCAPALHPQAISLIGR